MRDEDSRAFEALAMPLFASLYNFAHWLTHNQEEAEDLVQETYMKALKAFGSFREGTNFRAWMFTILRNAFLSSRTAQARTVSLDDEEDGDALAPATTETPETLLFSSADQNAVQRALDALPEHFREIILLCDVEEMRYHEAAETLGVPIGTVMSRLSRARKALRQALATHARGAKR